PVRLKVSLAAATTPEKDWLWSCTLSKRLRLQQCDCPSLLCTSSEISCCGESYGSALSSTELVMVKIAVLPPMPSASVKIAAMAKPGFLRSMRAPKRRSCRNECIEIFIIGRCVMTKVSHTAGALLFLTSTAYFWPTVDRFILDSGMDIFAHKHHQRVARTQLMCAVLAIQLPKPVLHFRDLWLQGNHNRL